MTKRDPKELIPLVMSFLSAAFFVEVPKTSLGIFPSIFIGLVVSAFGVVYGWRYGDVYGRNAIIFLGVSVCIIIFMLGMFLLFLAYIWS